MARQTQNLAVLFADICESTKLYTTLGDNAARVVVNACLSLISGVVDRHHGRVVKTIGDEIMCVFRRADDAVMAASEMQASVDSKRPGKYHVKLPSACTTVRCSSRRTMFSATRSTRRPT